MTSALALINPITERIFPQKTAPGGVATTITDNQMANARTAAGAVTVRLPAPSALVAGMCFGVVDLDGNAGVNAITVDGNGTTIDGAATAVLGTAGLSACFVFDGDQLRRLAARRSFGAAGPVLELYVDSPAAAAPAAPTGVLPAPTSIGSNPALTGDCLRLGPSAANAGVYNDVIKVRQAGADMAFLNVHDGASYVNVGDPGYSMTWRGYTNAFSCHSFGAHNFYVGNSYALALSSTTLKSGVPIIGEAMEASPYGVHGMAVKAMAGGTAILTATESAMGTLKITGTGTNVVKYPAATSDDPRAYAKYVWNAGAAGTIVVVRDTNDVGPAATLAAGQGAWFEFSLNSVKQLTAAFAVA